jgi:hypothetical protein
MASSTSTDRTTAQLGSAPTPDRPRWSWAPPTSAGSDWNRPNLKDAGSLPSALNAGNRGTSLPACRRWIPVFEKLAPSPDDGVWPIRGPAWKKARIEEEQITTNQGTGFLVTSGYRNQPVITYGHREGDDVSQKSRNQPDTESNCRAADGEVSKKSRNQPDTESNRRAVDGDVGLAATQRQQLQNVSPSSWPTRTLTAAETTAVPP